MKSLGEAMSTATLPSDPISEVCKPYSWVLSTAGDSTWKAESPDIDMSPGGICLSSIADAVVSLDNALESICAALQRSLAIGNLIHRLRNSGETDKKPEVVAAELASRIGHSPRLKRSALWYAEHLPWHPTRFQDRELFLAFPLSHHRLLIHVVDTERMLDLAERAREEMWSRRNLDEEIKKENGNIPVNEVDMHRNGRPKVPRVIKLVDKVCCLKGHCSEKKISSKQFEDRDLQADTNRVLGATEILTRILIEMADFAGLSLEWAGKSLSDGQRDQLIRLQRAARAISPS
jgi:hypothetical protein